MLDFAQARRNMVDSQLRTYDVNDLPLLAVISDIPRERFVPAEFEGLAYSDQEIPLRAAGPGRVMLRPMFLARMIQALAIRPGERTLDVGSGFGYGAAIMAGLGASVVALEESEALGQDAAGRLKACGLPEVRTVAGPLGKGHAEGAPYDAILVNGAVELRPEALLQQLNENGRLVCIQRRPDQVGRAGQAMLYVRAGDAFGARPLFDAGAPLLEAFRKEPGFVF